MTTPDDLEVAARRLTALAATVGAGLDHIVAYHRPDVWQGVRAVRFGVELLEQRAQLRAAADHLAAEARLLQSRADLVRATQAFPP